MKKGQKRGVVSGKRRKRMVSVPVVDSIVHDKEVDDQPTKKQRGSTVVGAVRSGSDPTGTAINSDAIRAGPVGNGTESNHDPPVTGADSCAAGKASALKCGSRTSSKITLNLTTTSSVPLRQSANLPQAANSVQIRTSSLAASEINNAPAANDVVSDVVPSLQLGSPNRRVDVFPVGSSGVCDPKNSLGYRASSIRCAVMVGSEENTTLSWFS